MSNDLRWRQSDLHKSELKLEPLAGRNKVFYRAILRWDLDALLAVSHLWRDLNDARLALFHAIKRLFLKSTNREREIREVWKPRKKMHDA